ncbi:hypothetical protein D5086_011439 [Populus alba]|uniref:Uncharacterized protein n=1 Tax=Populus alba TaxID=43335 RepID=A0ACC4CCH1_POPAL
MFANRNRGVQWTSDLILNSPSATVVLPLFLDDRHVLTGNPANVQHMLKTQFYNYEKGSKFRRTLFDFLGNAEFAKTFDEAARISSDRFSTPFPFLWKIKRVFNIGSEKRLKEASSELREFARNIIKEKKQELGNKSSLETVDLLSRFLSSGHSDEDFVTDIVISFILAGRDTTSAALTWYFWLLSQNPEVEREILREIKDKSESPVYEEVKDMVYTHASLCESMRLYPPVPVDTKVAMHDDVLPDGTVIKKGTAVSYHPYVMGRLQMLWGPDWKKFKPERWLQGAGDGVVPAAKDGVEPVFVTYLTSKMQGGFPVRY